MSLNLKCTNNDCKSDQLCVGPFCFDKCSGNSDCKEAGLVCDSGTGFCTKSCSQNKDCVFPQAFNCDSTDSMCRLVCKSDNDCPSNLPCFNGMCMAKKEKYVSILVVVLILAAFFVLVAVVLKYL